MHRERHFSFSPGFVSDEFWSNTNMARSTPRPLDFFSKQHLYNIDLYGGGGRGLVPVTHPITIRWCVFHVGGEVSSLFLVMPRVDET